MWWWAIWVWFMTLLVALLFLVVGCTPFSVSALGGLPGKIGEPLVLCAMGSGPIPSAWMAVYVGASFDKEGLSVFVDRSCAISVGVLK